MNLSILRATNSHEQETNDGASPRPRNLLVGRLGARWRPHLLPRPAGQVRPSYKGNLTVMVVGDQASVRRMCYDVTFQPEVGAVACSRFNASHTWCDIFIADAATLKQTGWPRSLISTL